MDDVLDYALTNAEKLHVPSASDYSPMLYSYLLQRVKWLANNKRNSLKAKGRRDLELEGSEDEAGRYIQPTTFTPPEQENVVFMKQMIEACERLPEADRTLARLVFDRASASEMAMELGVSLKDIAIGTTKLARKLGA